MSRAHARTCEDLDPDLADAVSTMLLAIAADLKVATAGCHCLLTTRNRLTDAHGQLLEAARSLAEETIAATASVEACSARRLVQYSDFAEGYQQNSTSALISALKPVVRNAVLAILLTGPVSSPAAPLNGMTRPRHLTGEKVDTSR